MILFLLFFILSKDLLLLSLNFISKHIRCLRIFLTFCFASRLRFLDTKQNLGLYFAFKVCQWGFFPKVSVSFALWQHQHFPLSFLPKNKILVQTKFDTAKHAPERNQFRLFFNRKRTLNRYAPLFHHAMCAPNNVFFMICRFHTGCSIFPFNTPCWLFPALVVVGRCTEVDEEKKPGSFLISERHYTAKGKSF